MSDRQILVLVLSLNAAYMAVLFGFIGFRILFGLAPMPRGYGPLATGSAIVVPMLLAAMGNILRQRRDR